MSLWNAFENGRSKTPLLWRSFTTICPKRTNFLITLKVLCHLTYSVKVTKGTGRVQRETLKIQNSQPPNSSYSCETWSALHIPEPLLWNSWQTNVRNFNDGPWPVPTSSLYSTSRTTFWLAWRFIILAAESRILLRWNINLAWLESPLFCCLLLEPSIFVRDNKWVLTGDQPKTARWKFFNLASKPNKWAVSH